LIDFHIGTVGIIQFLQIAVKFCFILMASKFISRYVHKAHLPLITGFILTGILAGPYILGFIPDTAVKSLRFVDEISLAFIAFVAGGELYLKELTNRLKSIKWVTSSLMVFTFCMGSIAVYLMSAFIPFMQNQPPAVNISISILAGAILVARSPSSAIAIINFPLIHHWQTPSLKIWISIYSLS